MLSQIPQKCFYFETNHLFLFCFTKIEDKKKNTFLSINLQFDLQTGANTHRAKSINKEIYKKYMLVLIVFMILEDLELENYEYLD